MQGYTKKQVLELFDLDNKKLNELIKKGVFNPKRCGCQYRFSYEELEQFMLQGSLVDIDSIGEWDECEDLLGFEPEDYFGTSGEICGEDILKEIGIKYNPTEDSYD